MLKYDVSRKSDEGSSSGGGIKLQNGDREPSASVNLSGTAENSNRKIIQRPPFDDSLNEPLNKASYDCVAGNLCHLFFLIQQYLHSDVLEDCTLEL